MVEFIIHNEVKETLALKQVVVPALAPSVNWRFHFVFCRIRYGSFQACLFCSSNFCHEYISNGGLNANRNIAYKSLCCLRLPSNQAVSGNLLSCWEKIVTLDSKSSEPLHRFVLHSEATAMPNAMEILRLRPHP